MSNGTHIGGEGSSPTLTFAEFIAQPANVWEQPARRFDVVPCLAATGKQSPQ